MVPPGRPRAAAAGGGAASPEEKAGRPSGSRAAQGRFCQESLCACGRGRGRRRRSRSGRRGWSGRLAPRALLVPAAKRCGPRLSQSPAPPRGAPASGKAATGLRIAPAKGGWRRTLKGRGTLLRRTCSPSNPPPVSRAPAGLGLPVGCCRTA